MDVEFPSQYIWFAEPILGYSLLSRVVLKKLPCWQSLSSRVASNWCRHVVRARDAAHIGLGWLHGNTNYLASIPTRPVWQVGFWVIRSQASQWKKNLICLISNGCDLWGASSVNPGTPFVQHVHASLGSHPLGQRTSTNNVSYHNYAYDSLLCYSQWINMSKSRLIYLYINKSISWNINGFQADI